MNIPSASPETKQKRIKEWKLEWRQEDEVNKINLVCAITMIYNTSKVTVKQISKVQSSSTTTSAHNIVYTYDDLYQITATWLGIIAL